MLNAGASSNTRAYQAFQDSASAELASSLISVGDELLLVWGEVNSAVNDGLVALVTIEEISSNAPNGSPSFQTDAGYVLFKLNDDFPLSDGYDRASAYESLTNNPIDRTNENSDNYVNIHNLTVNPTQEEVLSSILAIQADHVSKGILDANFHFILRCTNIFSIKIRPLLLVEVLSTGSHQICHTHLEQRVKGSVSFDENNALYGNDFASSGIRITADSRSYISRNTDPFAPSKASDSYEQRVVQLRSQEFTPKPISVFADSGAKLYGKVASEIGEDGWAAFLTWACLRSLVNTIARFQHHHQNISRKCAGTNTNL